MADRRFAYCCTYFSVSFSYKCYFYFYFYFYGNKKSPSPGDEWVKKERERRAHVVSYHLLRGKQRLLESGRGFSDRLVHEVVAESDDVRATVVDVAHQQAADAIVVGSRGHGTIKRALLGSLSSHLVHHFDGKQAAKVCSRQL